MELSSSMAQKNHTTDLMALSCHISDPTWYFLKQKSRKKFGGTSFKKHQKVKSCSLTQIWKFMTRMVTRSLNWQEKLAHGMILKKLLMRRYLHLKSAMAAQRLTQMKKMKMKQNGLGLPLNKSLTFTFIQRWWFHWNFIKVDQWLIL